MKLRWLAAAACLLAGAVLADGMPIQDGRFVGAVTVITLTKAQRGQVDKDWARLQRWRKEGSSEFGGPTPRIALTARQRAQLRKDSGKAPRFFLFYETRFGQNDCTCHAANNALRFSETQAEIPHEYLKSDAEVRKMEREMRDA
jgi:hypothetical protein